MEAVARDANGTNMGVDLRVVTGVVACQVVELLEVQSKVVEKSVGALQEGVSSNMKWSLGMLEN